jgi:hypothetical protein
MKSIQEFWVVILLAIVVLTIIVASMLALVGLSSDSGDSGDSWRGLQESFSDSKSTWCELPGVAGIHADPENPKRCLVDRSIVQNRDCKKLEEKSGSKLRLIVDSSKDSSRCILEAADENVTSEDARLSEGLAWAGMLRDVAATEAGDVRYLTVPGPAGRTSIHPFFVEASGSMRWALVMKYVSKNLSRGQVDHKLGPAELIQAAAADRDIGGIKAATPSLDPFLPFASRVLSEDLWPLFPATHARVVVAKNGDILAEYIFRLTYSTTLGGPKVPRLAWMSPDTFVSARFANGIRVAKRISTDMYPAGFGVQGLLAPGPVNLSFSIRMRPLQSYTFSMDTCPNPDAGLLMCPSTAVLLQPPRKSAEDRIGNARPPGSQQAQSPQSPQSPQTSETSDTDQESKPCWVPEFNGFIIASRDGLHVSVRSVRDQLQKVRDQALPESLPETVNLATHVLMYLGVTASSSSPSS